MSWDIIDDIESSDLIRICFDCHCVVIRYAFDHHKENCLAYLRRWQKEYDAQLGASEISPNWKDKEPSTKLQEALEFLKSMKVSEAQNE